MDELIYNAQGQIIRRAEVTFKVDTQRAKIGQVKPSKNKKFIAVELIKEQPFGLVNELKTLEYVFFKADSMQMHRSKIVLHLDKTQPHDFDLSDEV
jgi:hypothetical protein